MNRRGKCRPKTRHAEIGNERPSAFPAAASVKENGPKASRSSPSRSMLRRESKRWPAKSRVQTSQPRSSGSPRATLTVTGRSPPEPAGRRSGRAAGRRISFAEAPHCPANPPWRWQPGAVGARRLTEGGKTSMRVSCSRAMLYAQLPRAPCRLTIQSRSGERCAIPCKYRFEASRLTVGQPGLPLSIIAASHQGRPITIVRAGAIAAWARQ